MKTINFFFLSIVLSLFAFTACQDDATVPAPEPDIPRVRDISITEIRLQQAEDGLFALNLDVSVIPGVVAPQGSFSVRIYEEARLLHSFDISLAGIPSEKCCQNSKCEEVEGWTYTCDALCDNNSRDDGCNYHRQRQVFLALEAGAAIRAVVNEERAIQETADAAGVNNTIHFTVPEPQESVDPANLYNPYDEVGRRHNEQLQALLYRIGAEPAFADRTRDEQQRAVLEWAVMEAMAVDESAAAFAMPKFLYAYTGHEGGLMREASLEDFKTALERLDVDEANRHQLAHLFQLLQEHPLEGRADMAHLLAAIRTLEAGWMEDQGAAAVEMPLIAASVARYSLYFWAARQPVPFQGPQLFGIREGFFADAFGAGIGAAAGAIGGPKGALVGGLIGGVASSVVFAIE